MIPSKYQSSLLTCTVWSEDMKPRTLLGLTLVLSGVWFGTMPARSEGTNDGAYAAYWLTNKAVGHYVKLVLTRRPLADLPNLLPADKPASFGL